jgi:hypothetical protein
VIERAIIHVAGPAQPGYQECRRCGYIFHDYRDGNVAKLADDPHDPMESCWPEGEEVLVIGHPLGGRYMARVSGLRPDRETSDEVPCG